MASKQPDTTQTRDERAAEMPRQVYWRSAPFQALQRFSDEVDRMWGRDPSRLWQPAIDVSHRNGQLTVKADLPGLTKDEVSVDITDDTVTIQGERRREHQEERDGVFRSERSYGTFCRIVPLPQGAHGDQAKARSATVSWR